MKRLIFIFCLPVFFLSQGCQTLKDGAEISYVIRENGFHQERQVEASRRRIDSLTITSNTLSLTVSELEYSTVWSFPIMERLQISDRTLSRIIAAGGVFFTAGLAYFDKDFERMWGNERIDYKVTNSWVDRSKGKRDAKTTTVKNVPVEGYIQVTTSRAQGSGIAATEVFKGIVHFRSGVTSIDLKNIHIESKELETITLIVRIDQPSNFRPVPPPFSFDDTLGIRSVSYSIPRQLPNIRDLETLRRDAETGAKTEGTGSKVTKVDRCKRLGLLEGTKDFSLCLRSLK